MSGLKQEKISSFFTKIISRHEDEKHSIHNASQNGDSCTDEDDAIAPSPEVVKDRLSTNHGPRSCLPVSLMCRKSVKRKANMLSPSPISSKMVVPQTKPSCAKKLKEMTCVKQSISAENNQVFKKNDATLKKLNFLGDVNDSFENLNLSAADIDNKGNNLPSETSLVSSDDPTKMKSNDELDNTSFIDCEVDEILEKLMRDERVQIDLNSSLTGEKTSKNNGCRKMIHQHNFQRFRVLQIEDGRPKQVRLLLNSEVDGNSVHCILQGFWMDTYFQEGDIVHIDAPFSQDGVVINDHSGLVIVNPDFLVSGTSIVSMLFCRRKSVLNQKFRGCDVGSVSMLYGTLIHQLFQKVILERVESLNQVLKFLDCVICLSKNLHEIYGHGLSEEEVKSQMKKYVPHIYSWYTKNLVNAPKNEDFEIQKIIDIEENYWCPRYGIKGKIDTTVGIYNKRKKISQIIPLELKTGRPSFSTEHQGQLALYSMMMKDRYPGSVGDGILLYLQDGAKMKSVSLDGSCKSGLIQLRNELAYFLTMTVPTSNDFNFDKPSSDHFLLPSLPEPINNSRACAKCPQILNCSLYQRSVEKIDHPISHAMHKLIPTTLDHLKESHLHFFTHWYLLMHLELQQNKSTIKKIWLLPAYERELKGECFSSMKLAGSVTKLSPGEFLHTFKRDVNHQNAVPLPDVGLNTMDVCVVSDQCTQNIALSSGFISEISSEDVKLILDRDLSCVPQNCKLLYRIESNDYFSTISTNLTNLSLLMSAENSELREFIIDKAKPFFKNSLSKDIVIRGRSILKNLNKPQQKAIFKTLMGENYVLIKGMPGTGKTSTIVALIRILRLVGQSVLVTAYTHSAVDNILLRLKQDGFTDFVRLGKLSRTHKEIQPFSSEILTEQFTSVKELSEFYQSKGVVATTCLGSNHVLFRQRKFDICIVDEASQVLLPSCLGPLFHAKRFVLVGDPKQLPPLVQSKVAEELGMGECLFSRLYSDSSSVDLHLQYRMNSEITRISNQLTYEGLLMCGSEKVENATLSFILTNPRPERWISDCFNSTMRKSVMLLNTDSIPLSQCQDQHGYIFNPGETEIVLRLCAVLAKGGIDLCNVGIITPYRRQVLNFKKFVCENVFNVLEVNTVDQYQGREKQVIIISCVRTTVGDSEIGILHDFRRLNVAVTRAKQKLIIVGSKSTLTHLKPFRELISFLHEEQMIDLPISAVQSS